MTSNARQLARKIASAAAFAVMALLSASCASSDDHAPAAPGTEVEAGTPPTGSCGIDTGCPCDHPGDSIDCRAYRKSGDYVACSAGHRLCGADARWGECIGDEVAK